MKLVRISMCIGNIANRMYSCERGVENCDGIRGTWARVIVKKNERFYKPLSPNIQILTAPDFQCTGNSHITSLARSQYTYNLYHLC